MKHKSESLFGFIADFVVFGGTASALIGADSPEFGNICRMILGAECAVGIIILLCVLAYFSPNKPGRRCKYNTAYVSRERINNRDGRCLGYVSPDAIRRAARGGRK